MGGVHRTHELHEFLRDLIEKTRTDAVEREGELLFRPRHRDVHQAALLFDLGGRAQGHLMRQEPLGGAGDYHAVELQPLRKMDRHNAHGAAAVPCPSRAALKKRDALEKIVQRVRSGG